MVMQFEVGQQGALVPSERDVAKGRDFKGVAVSCNTMRDVTYLVLCSQELLTNSLLQKKEAVGDVHGKDAGTRR